jgi:hypothetical protein
MKTIKPHLRRIFTVFALGLSSLASTQAAINLTFGGTTGPTPGYGLISTEENIFIIDFNGLDRATQGTSYVDGSVTFSGLTAGPSGSIVIGDSDSQYKAPENDTTNYLSVGGARSNAVTIDFASGISYFGLYWGTPDTYNSIQFFDANNVSLGTYTPPSSLTTSAYYNFTLSPGDSAIARVVLSSSSAAMEVDNFAFVVVPEPGTCALFGAAAFGLLIFRRRSTRS